MLKGIIGILIALGILAGSVCLRDSEVNDTEPTKEEVIYNENTSDETESTKDDIVEEKSDVDSIMRSSRELSYDEFTEVLSKCEDSGWIFQFSAPINGGNITGSQYVFQKDGVYSVLKELSFVSGSIGDLSANTQYSVSCTEESIENNESIEGLEVAPEDIHSYVECGSVVYVGSLSNSDIGDVELTEVYKDRYVEIYTDGTYYYMMNSMEDQLVIANVE